MVTFIGNGPGWRDLFLKETSLAYFWSDRSVSENVMEKIMVLRLVTKLAMLLTVTFLLSCGGESGGSRRGR